MNHDILTDLQAMRAAARKIDDRVADFKNELTLREREDLDRESDIIRRSMLELSRGVFSDTGAEFEGAQKKLNMHIATLRRKLRRLQRAQEIANDVRNIVLAVDELLRLASAVRPIFT